MEKSQDFSFETFSLYMYNTNLQFKKLDNQQIIIKSNLAKTQHIRALNLECIFDIIMNLLISVYGQINFDNKSPLILFCKNTNKKWKIKWTTTKTTPSSTPHPHTGPVYKKLKLKRFSGGGKQDVYIHVMYSLVYPPSSFEKL